VVVDSNAFGAAARVGFIAQFDVENRSGCVSVAGGWAWSGRHGWRRAAPNGRASRRIAFQVNRLRHILNK
jgi:hypothetical protein